MEDIELTLRLFMNHKQACQAIGRNGTNIKSLREETGCKVTISNKEHQNRVMTLQSKKSIAMKAIQRLAEILESEINSYGASARLVPISITLIIPKNLGGMIIGKKGETLKDLRVKSGAQIVMSSDCLAKSDERSCRLTGSNFAVVAAVDLIVEIIIKAAIQEGRGEFKGTPSSQITPYDPKNDTNENGKERDENDDKIVKLATAFLAANQMIENNLEYVPIEVSDQTQELRVPEKHIGAIMGRGGKRINDTRMMSGCKIKIEREDGSGVRRITLNGERQKIIMATFLINQLISGFSTADKNEPKIEPVKPVVSAGNVVPGNGEEAVSQENMNSLAPAGSTTEEQAAAAMTAFFTSQFSGSYQTATPGEYIPSLATESYVSSNDISEELKRGHIEQVDKFGKPIPDMYTIPDKKPKLHY